MAKNVFSSVQNLAVAQRLAKSRNGLCLSKSVLNRRDHLEWKCADGHKWHASLQNVIGNRAKKGTWCPFCNGVRNSESWLSRARQAAKAKRGVCLSKSCSGSRKKLTFECEKGHEWRAAPVHVIGGSWCPVCAGNQKDDLSDFRKIAKERGGQCLSSSYKNQKSTLSFRCSKLHEWTALAGNIKSGSWCPVCAGNVRLSLFHLKQIAKERGGWCLSKEYRTANKKYDWKCINGHRWRAAYSSIYRGSWCPQCSEFLGEKITRIYFEKVFGMKFKKCRPIWLREEVGDPWELDGFSSKKLEGRWLAFEHQGIQHYRDSPFFHRQMTSHRKQLYKDRLRRLRCRKNGVALFEIPQLFKLTTIEDLPEIVEKQFLKFKFASTKFNFYQAINFSDAYKVSENDVLRDTVKGKGGKVLGTALNNNKIYIEIECTQKHNWKATKGSILAGSWCPYCSGKKKIGGWYAFYSDLAKKRGGKCLSPPEAYRTARASLTWMCARSHIWQTPPSVIQRGGWCPQCSIELRSNSQRDSIENMKQIAKSRGGICLGKKYLNTHSKLKWRCKFKHVWSATPASVKQGTWCPRCRGERK